MNTRRMTGTLQSAALSALSSASKEIDRLPSRVIVAKRQVGRLGARGVRYMKRHPLGAIVAAFAAGVAVTMLGRRA
jgi:hypothetical protein